jgi:hypothetical protein
MLRCPVPQEPAITARWVFRAVAGDAPGPGRRILGGIAVSLLVVVLSIVVPLSVLASLWAIANLLDGNAVAKATTDRPAVAWGLVAVTSLGLVGAAAAVSWTSGRRTVHRHGRESLGPPRNHEKERRSEAEEERATRPLAP